MNEEHFWNIIMEVDGNADAVTASLGELDPASIDEWDRIYWEKHNALHRWDVWGAAYVINGGCGDDAFHYFKAWAIGKGQDLYSVALRDPDAIGPMINEEDIEEMCDNEALNCAAQAAFEKHSVEELELRSHEHDEPAGERWEEEELEELFPRLYAQFSG